MFSGILFSKPVSVLIRIIKRGTQRSPVQRGSPNRQLTTDSASGDELKLKYLGQTSQKTPSALVLTFNMQHSQRTAYSCNASMTTRQWHARRMSGGEHKPSGFVKCEEFLDYVSVLLASPEELCSME
jgi:hypothetical protein